MKQRLEYTDFSAGITENFVPGKPNAYQRADNLLITRDKHLESRSGSQILGSLLYQLPTGSQRVGGLIPYHNETNLFATSGKELFYVNASNSWSTLKSPAGASAFTSNFASSIVTSAEWRKHLYLLPDGGDGPQMVYPDQNGVLQLRQAGLPKPVVPPNYTSTTLLTAAITLATNLAGQMVLHLQDTGGAGHAHIVAHTSAANAILALSTPTSVATLITYVQGLVTNYDLHIVDAQLDVAGPQVYHINKQKVTNLSTPFLGRYSVLNVLASTNLSPATDLNSTIAILNDLRNRYNFHTWSTLTHENAVTSLSTGLTYATDSSGYGKYACTLPVISQNTVTVAGLVEQFPVFSDGLGSVYAYINQLKSEFNSHVGNGVYHNNADTDNPIVAPNCTDQLSAWVLLAHLDFFYWWHYQDASSNENDVAPVVTSFPCSSSNGSTTLNVSGFSSFSTPTLLMNILATPAFSAPGWVQGRLCASQRCGVIYTNSTTLTLSSAVSASASASGANLASGSTFEARMGTMEYHYDIDTVNGPSLTSPTLYNVRVQNYDYTLSNPNALFLAATVFEGLFASHETSQWSSKTSATGQPAYFISNTMSLALYCVHNAPSTGGAVWPQSTIPNPAGGNYTQTQAAAYLNNTLLIPVQPIVIGSVLYTMVWRYNYELGLLTFEDVSTPAQESQISSYATSQTTALPSTSALYPISLSGLPILTNGVGQNWDTANISLDIYRTTTNGQTFFLVGTVANGTTTFTDSVTDTILPSGQQLYTTGGVLSNDIPPISKFITIMNSTAYYGYVQDITSGEVFPNRVLQSIEDAPTAVPAANFDDLDDDLTGLSNFNSYVVAFCQASLFRLEGNFDELGNGGITHQEISKTAGCVSHKSIAQTEYGIFFAGTNGIFWTDAYKITKTTTELDKTYASYVSSPSQRSAVFSAYDRINRRIFWAFKSNPTTAECDVVWVLDLNWGISEKMSFTTMSGGPSFTPTALAFYQGQILRGDAGGYCFKYDPTYKSDPLIDSSTAATGWSQQPVLWDFISCATNFGSSQIRKWVTRITIQGQNRSNLSLAISAKNDNGKSGFVSLVPIRSRINPRWGDYTIKWNDGACLWKYDGMIDDFRRFPAGTLRCDWKTVRFTNAYVIVANSDSANTTGYATGSGD